MNIDRKFMLLGMAVVLGSLLLFLTCAPPKTEPVKTGTIPDGEVRPGQVGPGLSPGIRLGGCKSKHPKPPTSKYKMTTRLDRRRTWTS